MLASFNRILFASETTSSLRNFRFIIGWDKDLIQKLRILTKINKNSQFTKQQQQQKKQEA